MDITIRRAEERDIPAILELLKQVNRVHHEGRPDLFHLGVKYTEEELRAVLAEEEMPVFVAEKDGRVVGHGFCILQRPDNTHLFTDIKTLYVDDMCVDENVRGQQVGKKLYESIVAYARQIGCHNVTMNVWNCNPPAQAMFEHLGLKPYRVSLEEIL